jgi:hypothetical protein
MGSERVVRADDKNGWERMARATKNMGKTGMSTRF